MKHERVTIHMPGLTLAAVKLAAERAGVTPHAWLRQAIDEKLVNVGKGGAK